LIRTSVGPAAGIGRPAGNRSGCDARRPSRSSDDASKRLASAGSVSEGKAHVFVAMPFKDDMDDVYHYGIQNAVHADGLLCERADLSSFTGDVLEWIPRVQGGARA